MLRRMTRIAASRAGPLILPPPGGPLIRADTVILGLPTEERAAQWATACRALLEVRALPRPLA